MSRLSLTVLKHLPIGLWLIVAWCGLQAVLLLLAATRVGGYAGTAAILAAAVQIALAFGLLLRLRWVRLLLIAGLAAILFAGTVVVAVLALLYAYVGLTPAETLLAGLAAAYYLFLVWAFFYLFHPGLTDVFEWYWAQNLADSQPATQPMPA